MDTFEYKTQILRPVIGRDKMKLKDLESTLRTNGAEGWELVDLSLRANIAGERDGHLLIFKRRVQS